MTREVKMQLEQAGFVLVRTNKHHFFQHPKGMSITVAVSPRCAGTQMKRVKSDIKRALRSIGAK